MSRDEDGGVGGKGSDYADQDNDLYRIGATDAGSNRHGQDSIFHFDC